MQTRIEMIKNKALDTQKEANNEVASITKLHLCCTSSCPLVFHLSPRNSHDAPEGRKLIESIYSKNNNYLLMDRAYEDDKTLILVNRIKSDLN